MIIRCQQVKPEAGDQRDHDAGFDDPGQGETLFIGQNRDAPGLAVDGKLQRLAMNDIGGQQRRNAGQVAGKRQFESRGLHGFFNGGQRVDFRFVQGACSQLGGGDVLELDFLPCHITEIEAPQGAPVVRLHAVQDFVAQLLGGIDRLATQIAFAFVDTLRGVTVHPAADRPLE